MAVVGDHGDTTGDSAPLIPRCPDIQTRRSRAPRDLPTGADLVPYYVDGTGAGEEVPGAQWGHVKALFR